MYPFLVFYFSVHQQKDMHWQQKRNEKEVHVTPVVDEDVARNIMRNISWDKISLGNYCLFKCSIHIELINNGDIY